MKSCILLSLLSVVLLQAKAQTKCSSQNDCAEDECCVAKGIFGLRKGDCQKLATEGEPCTQEVSFFKEKFLNMCPCVDGFSCEPTTYKNIIFIGEMGFDEKCKAAGTVEPTPTSGPEPETEGSPEPEPEKEASSKPEKEVSPEPEKEASFKPEKEVSPEPEKEGSPEPALKPSPEPEEKKKKKH